MALAPLTLLLSDKPGEDAAVLLLPGGIGLTRRDAELKLELTEGQGLSGHATLKDCRFSLGAALDGLLAKLLPGGATSEGFPLSVRFDTRRGVDFGGGPKLSVTIPLNLRLPGVSLPALHLGAATEGGDLAVTLTADVAGKLLGLLDVAVADAGVRGSLRLSGPGEDGVALGPAWLHVGAKPPRGAGLSLDLGPVRGGGFLDLDAVAGRYAGSFAAKLLGLGITVTGLVQTKPGFSLLAVLSADFRPVGIDVGFGFTVNRVGGIIGLNRSVDRQALADGVRSNAIASVLFPADPVANAPRIVADLARLFPPAEGRLLIGPIIELGWGKPTGFISLAVGMIVELPDPALTLLGILRVLVPPGVEQAPLRIQVNVAARVDFGRGFIAVGGSLFDSRLLTFTLEGDFAARFRLGSRADFGVSLGGFHPGYTAAADLEFPALRRVAINLLPTTDNPRLRIESYYAITSNTLQHGAALDLYAGAAGFELRGHLGYDVLVQLSPLHFDARFGGSVAVSFEGEDLFSLRFDLHLTGPSPFHAVGSVRVKILFISATVRVDATFGSADRPVLPDADVQAVFAAQFGQAGNWAAALPSQDLMLVRLAQKLSVGADAVLAHPASPLSFAQKAVPLAVTLQRFGAAKPMAENAFDVAALTLNGAVWTGNPLSEEFAPGQFFEMSTDERMAAPAFRAQKAGIAVPAAALAAFGAPIRRDVMYEPGVIDADAVEPAVVSGRFARLALDGPLSLDLLGGAALGRAVPTGRVPPRERIVAAEDAFRVVDSATMAQVGGPDAAGSHIAATQAMRRAVARDPALAGRLSVVPAAELA